MARKKKQYSDCVSSIERVRDFARESFIYGLKDKSEHSDISPRTYDETTRQMKDWFQDCLHIRTIKIRNKIKYLTLDCRDYSTNPIYKIWKTCSFTSNEIVFFFFLLDYLSDRQKGANLTEIHNEFWKLHPDGFNRSAAQKWLAKKGCPSGIVIKEDSVMYRLAKPMDLSFLSDGLDVLSEIEPVGVIGSFILDKQPWHKSVFRFKNNFVGQAFDCEVLCNLLFAIHNYKTVEFTYTTKKKEVRRVNAIPMKVLSSTQNGRQYLIGWDEKNETYLNYRIDFIKDIHICEKTDSAHFNTISNRFDELRHNIWGVSLGDGGIEHVELLLRISENEEYIINRLIREKRCGMVTCIDKDERLYLFEADVYDAHEMFPWLRTFLGRIEKLSISNETLEELFWNEVDALYKMYLIDEE